MTPDGALGAVGQSCRAIVLSLYASIPSIAGAIGIVLIVNAVYAIVATNVFSAVSPEYFANFGTSMFTMFQVRFSREKTADDQIVTDRLSSSNLTCKHFPCLIRTI